MRTQPIHTTEHLIQNNFTLVLAVRIASTANENIRSTDLSLTSKYDVFLPVFSIPLISAAQESPSAVRRLLNSIGTIINSIVFIGWSIAERFDVYKPFSFIESMIIKKSTYPDAKHRGCCSHKVVAVGFYPLHYGAEHRGMKTSARIIFYCRKIAEHYRYAEDNSSR